MMLRVKNFRVSPCQPRSKQLNDRSGAPFV